MSPELPIPETRVLAIASHVVYGHVGNTMAAFVLNSLGAEVCALNTVQYSNHVGYGQFKGTKASASEIKDLFQGLKDSGLDDFDIMLSGYMPSAEAVRVVGTIAQDLKLKATMKPGSFFWVLDPVIGDNGKVYVAEDCVPAYKELVRHADLILPNQYEAEWLSGVKIVNMQTLTQAIAALHSTYRVPHILITSVSLPTPEAAPSLSVIGSTMTSAGNPRIFKVQVPKIDCYFSGTGDMFAALILVRLREAVSKIQGLGQTGAWLSPDNVKPTELPLAIATEKASASMQEVLIRTKKSRDDELEAFQSKVGGRNPGLHDDKLSHRIITKASEVRLVRNMECLRSPQVVFRAEEMDFESH